MEVLLEEVRTELRRVAEGYATLDRKITSEVQRLETTFGRRFDSVEHALLDNSRAIRDLQQDVRTLQQDMRKLTERFEIHERAHA